MPALDELPPARIAPIVARVKSALTVKFELEGISAAFGKDLVYFCLGLIPPHHATLCIDSGKVRGIDPRPHHPAGRRTPLRAVKPSIGTPRQAVRHRMRIFQAKPGESHFRIPVRNV